MGDITIRLRGNRNTGEKDLVVEYESPPDATPLEHERRHREIVELLVREGAITRDDVEDIVFEQRHHRESAGEAAAEGQGG